MTKGKSGSERTKKNSKTKQKTEATKQKTEATKRRGRRRQLEAATKAATKEEATKAERIAKAAWGIYQSLQNTINTTNLTANIKSIIEKIRNVKETIGIVKTKAITAVGTSIVDNRMNTEYTDIVAAYTKQICALANSIYDNRSDIQTAINGKKASELLNFIKQEDIWGDGYYMAMHQAIADLRSAVQHDQSNIQEYVDKFNKFKIDLNTWAIDKRILGRPVIPNPPRYFHYSPKPVVGNPGAFKNHFSVMLVEAMLYKGECDTLNILDSEFNVPSNYEDIVAENAIKAHLLNYDINNRITYITDKILANNNIRRSLEINDSIPPKHIQYIVELVTKYVFTHPAPAMTTPAPVMTLGDKNVVGKDKVRDIMKLLGYYEPITDEEFYILGGGKQTKKKKKTMRKKTMRKKTMRKK